MTPWLRALRMTGLVGALGAGAVMAPYGAQPAHAAVRSAVVAAPSPGPSAPGTPTVPDGSGTHDGRGGHERPRRPDDGDRPDRPDARPPAESGPADSGSPRPTPTRSSPSPSASGTTSGPEPSRGGNPPGEGRQRPGHAEEREPEHDGRNGYAGRYRDDDGDDGVPEDPAAALPPARTEAAPAPSTAPPRSPAQSRTPTRAAAEPLPHVLPPGLGRVLI
ncbi:hypothetical protein, partial [Streptomyces sp. NPDC005549]|uniref:hypothetical protein n=1 Tax=Streptomyces sp. NPDC005549 TaxID=3154888 RepID=UPI0033B7CB49